MKKTPHQFLSDILKEYYSVILAEYGIHYYGLEENKRLYEAIIHKYEGEEYDLFSQVLVKLKDRYNTADFYMIEDQTPSLTLLMQYTYNEQEVEVYLSVSVLAKCYCFFIKTKNNFGNTIYFDPFFEYADLYNEIDAIIRSIFLHYIKIPYAWLRFKIRYIIPGVNHSSKETGQPMSFATVFDALFFQFDFSKNDIHVMSETSDKYDIFEKLDKSDPALLERFEFFKKEKKAELKPV